VAAMARTFHQSALRNTEPEVSAPSSQRGTARWSAAGPSAFKEPDGRDTPARRHYSVVLVGRRLLLESPAHARRESSCNVYRGTADAWLPPENAKRQCWAEPSSKEQPMSKWIGIVTLTGAAFLLVGSALAQSQTPPAQTPTER